MNEPLTVAEQVSNLEARVHELERVVKEVVANHEGWRREDLQVKIDELEVRVGEVENKDHRIL